MSCMMDGSHFPGQVSKLCMCRWWVYPGKGQEKLPRVERATAVYDAERVGDSPQGQKTLVHGISFLAPGE